MDSFATIKRTNELLCQGKINLCFMALDGQLKNGLGFLYFFSFHFLNLIGIHFMQD